MLGRSQLAQEPTTHDDPPAAFTIIARDAGGNPSFTVLVLTLHPFVLPVREWKDKQAVDESR